MREVEECCATIDKTQSARTDAPSTPASTTTPLVVGRRMTNTTVIIVTDREDALQQVVQQQPEDTKDNITQKFYRETSPPRQNRELERSLVNSTYSAESVRNP